MEKEEEKLKQQARQSKLSPDLFASWWGLHVEGVSVRLERIRFIDRCSKVCRQVQSVYWWL